MYADKNNNKKPAELLLLFKRAQTHTHKHTRTQVHVNMDARPSFAALYDSSSCTRKYAIYSMQ